jgi:hypothetical protein
MHEWINIIISACGIITTSIIAFCNYRFITRKKIELDKQIESYKHELQISFLKAQMKTTQLFEVYPELFAKIKQAYGILFLAYGYINPSRETDTQKHTELLCNDADSFFNIKLLFISEPVQNHCNAILNSMVKLRFSQFQNDTKTIFNELSQEIKALEIQMKKELSESSSILQ